MKPFQLEVRSDSPIFQTNQLIRSTQSPPAWSAKTFPTVLIGTTGRQMPGNKPNAIEPVDVAGKR